MRTDSNITSTLSDAELSFSYKINTMEELRERGLDEGTFLGFFKGTNIFYTLNTAILSNDDKSILCDALVRNGYVTATNQLMFSEDIYNEDFDRV